MSIKIDSPVLDMTPGEEFKMEHGYSRTMHNLMKKHGVSTPEEYRQIRRKRKSNKKVKVEKSKPVQQKGGGNAKKGK